MKEYIELFIGCIILWITALKIGIILSETKKLEKPVKTIIITLVFTIILTFVNLVIVDIMHGIIKIIISYSLFCFYYKLLFKQDNSKIIVSGFITYLSMFISEILIALITSIIFEINNMESMTILKNTVLINILICSIAYLLIKLTQNRMINIVKNSKFTNKGSIMIIFIILLTSTLLLFRIPLENWSFNIEFIITMIILLSFCIIGIFIIKQRSDIQKTTSMYQQLAEYSNITNNVLEEYRVVTHEHKNQLLVIRSMLENKDKDINDYVDNLLEKREGIKYKWIGQLNHLPLSGLKGLINYKILEIEALNLNKVITISNEVSKIKLEKLSLKQKDNLYSIIGIYLDNAIQAAKESKEKEINIEIYKENNELVIIIANSYKGKIELEKIDEYGYTTKGKKHGVGLSIVKNILQTDTTFKSKRYLLDNYFVQEIKINLKDIKSK